MKNKKGVELSIQTIVIVALAVLVLIVIAVIFTQRIGKGQEQLNVVTNPLEYRAACLALYQNDVKSYESCVMACENIAKKKQAGETPVPDVRCSLIKPEQKKT